MPTKLPYLTLGATLAYVGITAYNNVQKYSWDTLYLYHPLCACVFLVLAVIGILTSQQPHTQPKKHKTLITRHGYWQTAAAVFAMATNYIIYTNKELRGRPHLQTWHALAGTVVTMWWVAQVMGGALAWYFPRLVASGGAALKRTYTMHSYSGYAALLALTAAHGLALAGGYQGSAVQSPMWWVLVACLSLATALLLAGYKAKGPASPAGKSD